MKLNRPDKIAEIIKEVTKIDVFSNRRTLDIVDVRALFCYILSKDLKYRLVQIRDIIRKHRPYTHATVLYNVNLYDVDVRYRRPDLEELRLKMINEFSPYFTMLKKVNALTDETLIIQIINLIKQYEKNKQTGAAVCETCSN